MVGQKLIFYNIRCSCLNSLSDNCSGVLALTNHCIDCDTFQALQDFDRFLHKQNKSFNFLLYCFFIGGDFAISTTGEVTVVNSPDRESLDSYALVIHVIDGGIPALTFTTTLAILITGMNAIIIFSHELKKSWIRRLLHKLL